MFHEESCTLHPGPIVGKSLLIAVRDAWKEGRAQRLDFSAQILRHTLGIFVDTVDHKGDDFSVTSSEAHRNCSVCSQLL